MRSSKSPTSEAISCSIRHDFDAVNDVLAATYVDVVKDLDRVSRWVNSAARLGGGRAFNFSLRLARARAWQAASAMYTLSADGRRAYADELDRVVSVLALHDHTAVSGPAAAPQRGTTPRGARHHQGGHGDARRTVTAVQSGWASGSSLSSSGGGGRFGVSGPSGSFSRSPVGSGASVVMNDAYPGGDPHKPIRSSDLVGPGPSPSTAVGGTG